MPPSLLGALPYRRAHIWARPFVSLFLPDAVSLAQFFVLDLNAFADGGERFSRLHMLPAARHKVALYLRERHTCQPYLASRYSCGGFGVS